MNQGQIITGEYSTYSDSRIQVYNALTGYPLKYIPAHLENVRRLRSLPNGFVASASWDKTVKIWDPSNDWSLIRIYTGHTDWVNDIEYISNDTMASGEDGGSKINIWSINTGRTLLSINVESGCYALKLLPSGLLASGDRYQDYSIRYWNITNGTLIQKLNGHESKVNDLILISNNMVLASSSSDTTIRLWDTLTGAYIRVLTGHLGDVFGLKAVSSNFLASSSWDNTIRLWDITTGKLVRTLKNHTDYIQYGLDVISDSILVSGSLDKTIKFWNISTGQLIQTIVTGFKIASLIII